MSEQIKTQLRDLEAHIDSGRPDLQASLTQTEAEIERGRQVLGQMAVQQQQVLMTVSRLEGRAELLRELLAAQGEGEEPEAGSPP